MADVGRLVAADVIYHDGPLDSPDLVTAAVALAHAIPVRPLSDLIGVA